MAILKLLTRFTAVVGDLSVKAVTAGTTRAGKFLQVDTNKRLDTLCLGSLRLGAGAGTAVTATAQELNRSAGVTPGVAAPSKVVTASTDGAVVFNAPVYAGENSLQIVEADLNVAAGVGSDDGTAPSFIAAMMGNLIGDGLTETANYLGGVIGAYSVGGAQTTTYQAGAMLGVISDGVSEADGAFVAILDGDSSQTNANAAFAARSNNSTPGSGFDYGVDLKGEAHDGFDDLAILKADVRMHNGVCLLTGEGAPEDFDDSDPDPQNHIAGTGAGFAAKGSLYIDADSGLIYRNSGDDTEPAWTQLADN